MIAVCLVFCLVAVGTVYTQPWTIEEQYHALDLSRCTKVEGTWAYSGERLKVGERQNFELNPGDENFDKLMELIQKTEFQTRLTNLIPRGKGAVDYHSPEAGDFLWDLWFVFDKPVLLDDGSSVEGSLLNIYNFYGKITVRWMPGDDVAICKAQNQEIWLAEVFELISAQEG